MHIFLCFLHRTVFHQQYNQDFFWILFHPFLNIMTGLRCFPCLYTRVSLSILARHRAKWRSPVYQCLKKIQSQSSFQWDSNCASSAKSIIELPNCGTTIHRWVGKTWTFQKSPRCSFCYMIIRFESLQDFENMGKVDVTLAVHISHTRQFICSCHQQKDDLEKSGNVFHVHDKKKTIKGKYNEY